MVTFIFKSGAPTTFSAYFPRWQWITFNAYVAVFFDKVQLAEIFSMKINIDFRSYLVANGQLSSLSSSKVAVFGAGLRNRKI